MMFLKNVYNAKIKNIEDKIPDITNLTTNTNLNAIINVVKNKIPDITNIATTTALAVENKIPNVSKLVKKVTITQKLVKSRIKLLPIMIMINILVITIIYKLTSENFTAKLTQANLPKITILMINRK